MSRITKGRVGEHGFQILMRTRFDASDSGPLGEFDRATMRILRPDGVVVDATAGTLDASTGDFFYTPPQGFLDVPGVYQFQLILGWGTNDSVALMRSDIEEVHIGPSLPDP